MRCAWKPNSTTINIQLERIQLLGGGAAELLQEHKVLLEHVLVWRALQASRTNMDRHFPSQVFSLNSKKRWNIKDKSGLSSEMNVTFQNLKFVTVTEKILQ
jgi:hypothetical protein